MTEAAPPPSPVRGSWPAVLKLSTLSSRPVTAAPGQAHCAGDVNSVRRVLARVPALIHIDPQSRQHEIVADPEPHTRRLVAACGLPWDDACLAPHRNTRTVITASLWQARQPIYRSSVERWRRYEPWLGELRELAPQREKLRS